MRKIPFSSACVADVDVDVLEHVHGDDNEEVDVTLLWSKRRSYIYMQLLLIVVLVSLSLMLYYGKNGQRWQASFARSYCRGSLAGTLFGAPGAFFRRPMARLRRLRCMGLLVGWEGAVLYLVVGR